MEDPTIVTNEEFTRALEALRAEMEADASSYGFTLLRTQAVDVLLKPKGWFSRLMWPLIRYKLEHVT
jgi:hypothetical protein